MSAAGSETSQSTTESVEQRPPTTDGVDFLERLAESQKIDELLGAVRADASEQGARPVEAGNEEESRPVPVRPIGAVLREMPWRGKAVRRRRVVARNRAVHIGDPWVLPMADLFGALPWRGGVRPSTEADIDADRSTTADAASASTAPAAVALATTTTPAAEKPRKRKPRSTGDIAW